jgi:hypothetical protein
MCERTNSELYTRSVTPETFRKLTRFERELLERLIDAPLSSPDQHDEELRETLRAALSACAVRPFDEHGCLEFEGSLDDPRYPVVEGRAEDADGRPIEVILFATDDGKPCILEFNTYETGAEMPQQPAEFRVWVSGKTDTAVPPWQ